jgi:uncharacterized protein with PIN domain
MWSVIRTVLAVLNVLGAIAFCAYAAMDYSKRQAWSYNALLHDVALNGLPYDESETNSDNEKISDLLGKSGLNDVFSGANPPIATQQAELKRVKSKLDGYIAASTDKRSQIEKLAHILESLAITEGERERLTAIQSNLADEQTLTRTKTELTDAAKRALAPERDPKMPFDIALDEELQRLHRPSLAPLAQALVTVQKKSPTKKPDALFDDALDDIRQNLQSVYDDAFKAAETYKDRKSIVASLLFDLVLPLADAEAEAGKRVEPGQKFELDKGAYARYLRIVGAEAGVRAIQERATISANMVSELRLAIERDQNAFVNENQKLIGLLQEEAEKEAQLREALGRDRELLAKREALLNRRKEDIRIYDAELAKMSDETVARIAEVRSMSDELYKIRIATRNASEANQKLEQQIRSLEEKGK